MTMYLSNADLHPTGNEPAEFVDLIEIPTPPKPRPEPPADPTEELDDAP